MHKQHLKHVKHIWTNYLEHGSQKINNPEEIQFNLRQIQIAKILCVMHANIMKMPKIARAQHVPESEVSTNEHIGWIMKSLLPHCYFKENIT